MIDRSALPSIPDVLRRLGIEPGRGRRSHCPVHRGDKPTAFSWTDDGRWYCHRCGIGGDAITLVQRSQDLDCTGAMRMLGITPGTAPATDPAVQRRQRIRDGLRRWADARARALRHEHYVMERAAARAHERLLLDPDDEWAWAWLSWTAGQERIAYELDMLEGNEADRVTAFRLWREK